MALYNNCKLCPRSCGVDRDAGTRGFCGETAALRIGYAGIHNGEEPPVRGLGGSGTIFVSGCNLGCVFCQNFQLSQGKHAHGKVSDTCESGRVVDTAELARICLELQNIGAENINIVTGSHTAPALIWGVQAARNQGLSIPVLWNSSGYEGAETLELLKDVIDVYLPDLKTLDADVAKKYFNAPNYPESATAAILAMMNARPLRFGAGKGIRNTPNVILEGVIIRHLVIPGRLEGTRAVIRWFADNCAGRGAGGGDRAMLSLMTQYTPVQIPNVKAEIPGRFITQDEYDAVLEMLDEFGIENGFIQDLITDANWLPDFSRSNPFPSKLSVPVWHCLK
ncbi:MAG: radical SAM protein [Treponema sp.]|nr:radical SAM protein [Treponema sp.]